MRNRTLTVLPGRPTRPFPVATSTREGDPYETYNPRLRAIKHLRDLINDQRAGTDPNDPTVFVLDVRPHEQVWARAVVEMTGLFLSNIRGTAGFCRYRMILEADVRLDLGLDRPRAHLVETVESAGEVVDLFEARELALAEQRLDNPSSPVELAIAGARDAQQRTQERSAG